MKTKFVIQNDPGGVLHDGGFERRKGGILDI